MRELQPIKKVYLRSNAFTDFLEAIKSAVENLDTDLPAMLRTHVSIHTPLIEKVRDYVEMQPIFNTLPAKLTLRVERIEDFHIQGRTNLIIAVDARMVTATKLRQTYLTAERTLHTARNRGFDPVLIWNGDIPKGMS